jgi:hypothetical protein
MGQLPFSHVTHFRNTEIGLFINHGFSTLLLFCCFAKRFVICFIEIFFNKFQERDAQQAKNFAKLSLISLVSLFREKQ